MSVVHAVAMTLSIVAAAPDGGTAGGNAAAQDGGVASTADRAVALDDGAEIALDVDAKFLVRVPGLRNISSTCGDVAMVRTLGNDVVGVGGLSEGKCAISTTSATLETRTFHVKVSEPTVTALGEATPRAAQSKSMSAPETRDAGAGSRSDPIVLHVGETTMLERPKLSRLSTGKCCIDVLPDGSGRILVNGAEPGHTTLTLWYGDGEKEELHVDVVPKHVEAERIDPPPGTLLELEVGERRRIHVPDVTRIPVSDNTVDVRMVGHGDLDVIGFSPGRSTLILFTSPGPRVSYPVAVKPRSSVGTGSEPADKDAR